MTCHLNLRPRGSMKMKTIALLLAAALCALAQVAPTSSLSGTVTDPSGSLVPDAAVVLTNTGTNWTRNTTTDTQGRFQFAAVPPGAYELQVTAAGFAPIRQQGINLNVDVPATLRLTLSVASATTNITIQEDTPMVDAQSSALHQVVSEQYIEDLPLNGRNAASLVYMAPGAVLGKGTDTATYATNSDTLAISVNRTMGNQVSYKLDGASHQDNITNLNATFPTPDALSGFTVETNNFDAQYGGSGGAVVNIVTRSGTNQIHGADDADGARVPIGDEAVPEEALGFGPAAGRGGSGREQQGAPRNQGTVHSAILSRGGVDRATHVML